jgi:hypothetical protein
MKENIAAWQPKPPSHENWTRQENMNGIHELFIPEVRKSSGLGSCSIFVGTDETFHHKAGFANCLIVIY